MSASRWPEWHRFISHNCVACRAWLKTAAVKCTQWDSFPWLEMQGFPALSFWVLELPKQGRAGGRKGSGRRPAPSGACCKGNHPKIPLLPEWEAACRGDALPGSGLHAETPGATEGQVSHARGRHTVPRAHEVAASSPTPG